MRIRTNLLAVLVMLVGCYCVAAFPQVRSERHARDTGRIAEMQRPPNGRRRGGGRGRIEIQADSGNRYVRDTERAAELQGDGNDDGGTRGLHETSGRYARDTERAAGLQDGGDRRGGHSEDGRYARDVELEAPPNAGRYVRDVELQNPPGGRYVRDVELQKPPGAGRYVRDVELQDKSLVAYHGAQDMEQEIDQKRPDGRRRKRDVAIDITNIRSNLEDHGVVQRQARDAGEATDLRNGCPPSRCGVGGGIASRHKRDVSRSDGGGGFGGLVRRYRRDLRAKMNKMQGGGGRKNTGAGRIQ